MTRVIIIDQADAQLSEIAERLESAEINTARFRCVVSAVENAVHEPADLLVCADRLHGLDSLDLLTIRANEPRLTSQPICVVGSSPARKLECYKAGCDEYIQLPMDEAEIIFRICCLLRRRPSAPLGGDLSSVSLLDIIQMLMNAQKDGQLSIQGASSQGELFFREGQVYYAAYGDALGEDAFLELLRDTKTSGSFEFGNGWAPDTEANIEKRTDHLLLGVANVLDEEG